ncbi:MarR family winged helix-turn-helix transcriptional regulator [Microbacterium sp. SSM24]|uniref:MarR family winged helix-turn-helix transcriptional regulator n=1 Tax=Microbacterium sp. SSM24 TaxID=2991714 RepID=UPI0022263F21|nr:MarR family winged helix-turn-helix transcriptional regulator [Microbacterium sp. SSM24]MCW3492534.1 MarR family winged helix-turn-helix transcriptional regulator [Microbacterium sp. SSM24]
MTSAGTDERESTTRLDDDLSFLIARANALSIAAGNAALADFGLRVRSYSVLSMAAEAVGPSQREISDHLRLDPSQVVALVDDLQGRELVERRPDSRDRRANVVVATAAGRTLLAEARAAVLGAERALHSQLADDDRAVLVELLRRIAFSG